MSKLPEIISRKDAKAQGLKNYFTGKSCIQGHIDTRSVSNRSCRSCGNEKDRLRYVNNPEKERARSRAYQRKDLPTPTRPCPELCELCGRKPSGKRGMHLDHDHKTDKFRGWLCGVCNTSLGKFGDDVAGLQSAVLYIQRNTCSNLLPTGSVARKEIPISSGFLDYFPAAVIEVAKVSYLGNQQHNPGLPVHWSRGKSSDHADTLQRHFAERGTIDIDGTRHTAKMVWRALAILQLELEEAGAPIARGAKKCT